MGKRPGDIADVGYCRPPLHTRFQKGNRANPRGRPKGSKNVAAVLLDSAQEAVTVKEGGRRRSITKLEAMAKQIANKAASGDPRASQLLVQLLQAGEPRGERPPPAPAIDEADELVVQQLFARVREMAQLRFPGAAQHAVVRCRPGIVKNSETATIPDQRCTAARCTASGKSRE